MLLYNTVNITLNVSIYAYTGIIFYLLLSNIRNITYLMYSLISWKLAQP